MNVLAPQRATANATRLSVIDCDIHPRVKQLSDLKPFMTGRWWNHLNTYGGRARHGHQKGTPYPKAAPLASRRDAWPEGGTPGSDLDFLRKQLLDGCGIELGILNPLGLTGEGYQDDGLSAAVARAVNHWQVDAWTSKEPRLRASICVPYEDAVAAAEEIRHWAGNRNFAQVLLLSRTAEGLGKRRYWPIYEAAAEAGLPVGIHVFGYSGYAVSNAGWPSYYIEEMTEHASSTQAMVSSLVFEGVFERFPTLKVVLIESGLAWLPPLMWRMDRNWQRMRDEVPELKRPPSEYVRERLWVTTQPMEEPENRKHLLDTLQWLGTDHVMFATDYPHWDFDDPARALPAEIGPEMRRRILRDNAAKLYGF
jgi:predicted TIM-barrel fold metal-dependent hydrolase